MNDASGPKTSQKRRLWLAAAIVLVMFSPVPFLIPDDDGGLEFEILGIEPTPDGNVLVRTEFRNFGNESLSINSLVTVIESETTQRAFISSGAKRGAWILAAKQVRSLNLVTPEIPEGERIRVRVSRFRPPSWLDNCIHWLSLHFPGQDNRTWLREQIGPNSVPLYSDWFEYKPAEGAFKLDSRRSGHDHEAPGFAMCLQFHVSRKSTP